MTTTTSQERSAASFDSLFRALAAERRRAVVEFVESATATEFAKGELATELAAVTNDKRPQAVTDAERSDAVVTLVHTDLALLKDADVLDERDDGTIVQTDHWVYADLDFDGTVADRPAQDLDGVFEALADSRRRTILSVLAEADRRLTRRDLARIVAARETGATERSISDDRVDQVSTSLVHVHLPMLADAGVVRTDHADRVAVVDHPIVRTVWLDLTGESSSRGDKTNIDLTSHLAAIAPSSD